jgi:hypothetical protein
MATKRKTKSKRAPTAGTKQAKKATGRPTKYKPEYCIEVIGLCKLGLIDEEIAVEFGIGTTTLNAWKNKHPEFRKAIKAGKIGADAEVAVSLHKQATGYQYRKLEVVGKGDAQRVEEVDIVIEPNAAAAIFWLKNRRRNDWRDKHEIEHKGTLDVNLDEVRDGLQRKFDRISAAAPAAGVVKKPD